MSFVPRNTNNDAPSADNIYYLVPRVGGVNECIEIANGSVLPNCVGYCWGRAYEITGTKPTLSKNDASTWFANTSDGYQRGTIPALGAVACYSGGLYGGHVATIEQINSDGSCIISNSAYNGTRFWVQTIRPPFYEFQTGYTFLGFIYAYLTPSPSYNTKNKKFPWVLYANKLRKNITF